MTAATTAHCVALAPSKLTLLGGSSVMDVFAAGSPYQSLGDALGRGVVDQALLSEAQRGVLASVITAVKREGSAIERAVVGDFEGLLRSVESAGAEVAVLACTELPMVPVAELCEAEGRERPGVALVDPAALLASALLERC